ncbi:chemotaxis protein CheA [Oceanobacillus jeddahense]|uniref:Chemotaxis protein CheA n=1 Tax=Oceanobacillus jeddahense TaxID=1462527 RepID=A0ABY5JQV0_9BACI|nr:chemotaxis protein CheA [Oceanobacillus jeddahense]UUI02170.1 chemotaxis protein CheA [Oceanobacillus jeddahense]
MDTQQYLDIFLDESQEHLQSINDFILKLEEDTSNLEYVHEIFRSAHTLKGMAATMGYDDIASLTHKMENVLDLIRNEELVTNTEIIDTLFLAIDDLEDMVDSVRNGGDGKKDVSEHVKKLEAIEKGETIFEPAAAVAVEEAEDIEDHFKASDLDEFQLTVVQQAKEQGMAPYDLKVTFESSCILKGARAFMVFEVLDNAGEIIRTSPTIEEIEEGTFESGFTLLFLTDQEPDELIKAVKNVSEVETVEANVIEIDENTLPDKGQSEKKSTEKEPVQTDEKPVIEKVTEVPVKKSEPKKEAPKNKDTAQNNGKKTASKNIRVNLDKIDNLLNLFEEVVIDRSRLEVLVSSIDNGDLRETVEHLSRVSSDMQSLILAMRMVPIEQVFNRFPRMIRQLSKGLNKKIALEIKGAETEVDRTVIDEIGDPLVHLIRNSCDHGIESPEKRIANNKPEEGKLTLRAYHSGNHVFVEIEDDGAGVNREKVSEKAIENNIITSQEAKELSDDQVAALIMSSGFSTADTISDVSGRGVGLDVVKNKIEALGGKISVTTTTGKGSIFSIQLPLTLSIITTMLVHIQKETFAILLTSILETIILPKEKIMCAQGADVIDYRGKIIPVLFLGKVLKVPNYDTETDRYSTVIIKKGDKLLGLIVDELIGQQEVVLKSLGNYLGEVFAVSGVTILGDGEVALIIDPNALID